MAVPSLAGLLSYLRHLRPGAAADEDNELLVRFAAGDEPALEALVRRHAPLVWGVCRRVLAQHADVEDAFQATFLVLVRKARSLANGRPLAPWLHTVATRIATKARALALKRPVKAPAEDIATAEPDHASLREARAVVDEEVNRLPEKYRLPVVLCYLEGRTNEEAARRLSCPRGTILSRLSRARDWLRRRLERRGLAPAVMGLGELFAPLDVPFTALTGAGRATAASGTAAALAEGVLTTMFLQQLKWVGVACLVLVLGVAGAGWLGRAPGAQDKKDTGQAATEKKAPEAKKDAKPPLVTPRDEKREEAKVPPERALARTIDFSGWDDPKTTLVEALDQLAKLYRVTFDVNEKAFKSLLLNDVLRTEIANPPIPPMKTTLEVVLQKALSRLPEEVEAMYLIRKDRIEITTETAVRAELGLPARRSGERLLPLVYREIARKPLTDALALLAEDTGYSLVLDGRCEKQGATAVSAKLTNVPLDTAVQVLADMAGLDVVRLANVFYVTTEENAAKLREKQATEKARPERPKAPSPKAK